MIESNNVVRPRIEFDGRVMTYDYGRFWTPPCNNHQLMVAIFDIQVVVNIWICFGNEFYIPFRPKTLLHHLSRLGVVAIQGNDLDYPGHFF